MATVKKVSLSLPAETLAQAERRLAHSGESRSALITRLIAAALRELDERDAEERYLRGYQARPETEREKDVNRRLARSTMHR